MHDAPDDLRRSLQKQARDAGLLAPHVPKEWGGCGLDIRGQAVVFEAAGYSLLGPLALNCSAPDEGNMHLLEVVASERAEAAVPSAACDGRDQVVLRDDRAGAGRRFRPGHAVDDGGQGRRRLAHRRPQVVHQRRARRWVQHLHGPHQRSSAATAAARRCFSSTPTTQVCGSSATSGRSTRACSAGTARSCSTAAESARRQSSARSTGASNTPRYGWPRPG